MSTLNVNKMNLSGRMNLPRLTQNEIDALDAIQGRVVFNTTVNAIQFYDGTNWVQPRTEAGIVAATGGTVTNSGGFKIHQYTSTGGYSFTVTQGGLVDVLVVGGGGGGGGVIGGGGGAGGYQYIPFYEVTPGTYNVQVGAGGTGGNGWNAPKQYGDKGGVSRFGTIWCDGGGGGAAHGGSGNGPYDFMCGGSGGGAANQHYRAGTGASPTGNNFQGGQNSYGYHGGGKGPGSPGGTCFSSYGGNAGAGGGGARDKGDDVRAPYQSSPGGNGFYNSITGTSVGYAGGGGGGNRSPGNAGTGGLGGGGNGTGTTSTAPNGVTNSGSGGGGGGYNGSSGSRIGGNGGPGIVVVRYFTG